MTDPTADGEPGAVQRRWLIFTITFVLAVIVFGMVATVGLLAYQGYVIRQTASTAWSSITKRS